jgi:hypothetical protein
MSSACDGDAIASRSTKKRRLRTLSRLLNEAAEKGRLQRVSGEDSAEA